MDNEFDFKKWEEEFDQANKHNQIIFKTMMMEMFMLDGSMFTDKNSVLEILSFIHSEYCEMSGELKSLRKFYNDFQDRIQ